MTPGVAPGFEWIDTPAGSVLKAAAIEPLAIHAFTSRPLSFRDTSAEDDARRLAETLGVTADRIVRVKQIHGRTIATVDIGAPHADRAEADAIVSFDPTRAIAIHVADCVPILLADRHRRVVAAVHAGWRGTCANVAGAVVGAIADRGVPPSDLVAAIGPAIGPCCYQVDDRVRTTFLGITPDAADWFLEDGPGHWRLDLPRANADQLESAGLLPDLIHRSQVCTFEARDRCWSYRRDGVGTGRIAAAIRPFSGPV